MDAFPAGIVYFIQEDSFINKMRRSLTFSQLHARAPRSADRRHVVRSRARVVSNLNFENLKFGGILRTDGNRFLRAARPRAFEGAVKTVTPPHDTHKREGKRRDDSATQGDATGETLREDREAVDGGRAARVGGTTTTRSAAHLVRGEPSRSARAGSADSLLSDYSSLRAETPRPLSSSRERGGAREMDVGFPIAEALALATRGGGE